MSEQTRVVRELRTDTSVNIETKSRAARAHLLNAVEDKDAAVNGCAHGALVHVDSGITTDLAALLDVALDRIARQRDVLGG